MPILSQTKGRHRKGGGVRAIPVCYHVILAILVERQNEKRGLESTFGIAGYAMKVECIFLERMLLCISFDF